MATTPCLSLEHHAYNTAAHRGFAGHTFAPTVLTALCPNAAKRLLVRFMPQVTRQWHDDQALLHLAKCVEHRMAWSATADRAAQALLNRDFIASDYRISGIGRDDFSEEHKDQLRGHSFGDGMHYWLAIVHRMAAGHRHATALAYCRRHRGALLSH